ncbi:MAG: tRNA guanosine(34) transglycosylase Tgt [Deltaproteobacteria bacterium]|nr:tRNA guanosine(34) transglycosylase Tgt [Deltaproteobacteria bacterium]
MCGERAQLEIDATEGKARAGRVTLPRGSYETPIFMPVGTHATVKALTVEDLESINAEVILSNAYHLHLRPGEDLVQELGGLQRFMGWPRLILTDSGGYQVFSLRQLMRIDDEGVTFRSHINGSKHTLSPERAMGVQAALGSDIAMAFDQCPPSDASKADVQAAMERTTRWAERCVRQPRPDHQVRFGIVQGGLHLDLRRRHIEALAGMPFDGYALGGLSVGDTPEQMTEVLDAVASEMPAHRPRYLMGVGRPQDLLRAISAGIDMFDCVMPTRHARNGQLFTSQGRIVISNARHRDEKGPIDEQCHCTTCQRYSRAYLRHLYVAKEILYSRLATYHNVHFFVDLVRQARQAIRAGELETFTRSWLSRLDAADEARRSR